MYFDFCQSRLTTSWAKMSNGPYLRGFKPLCWLPIGRYLDRIKSGLLSKHASHQTCRAAKFKVLNYKEFPRSNLKCASGCQKGTKWLSHNGRFSISYFLEPICFSLSTAFFTSCIEQNGNLLNSLRSKKIRHGHGIKIDKSGWIHWKRLWLKLSLATLWFMLLAWPLLPGCTTGRCHGGWT